MAGIDDILTALKNVNTQLGQWVSALRRQQGNQTSAVITGVSPQVGTLLTTQTGRLVSVSVLVAGSAGTVNNASSATNADSSNALCATPATVGVYPIGAEFNKGLVANPGVGQSISVTFFT